MSRSLLLQSILGHMALLAEQHPKKAASPVAKRAKRYVQMTLNADTAPRATGAAVPPTPARAMRRAA